MESETTTFGQVAYYVFIVVDHTSWITTFSAVPRTFGIVYGYNILCLVLCGRLISILVVSYLPDDAKLNLIVGLCSNILAFFVCIPFQEELDIAKMYDRGLIQFRNFGIPSRFSNKAPN